MGNVASNIQTYFSYDSETTPCPNVEPTFDPMYGFPNGRKPRVMIATEDELLASQIPVERRDYCAHWLIRFQHCRRDYHPFNIMCSYQKHKYDECQINDYIMRMKEFERERRLRRRERRKKMQELQAGSVAA